MFFTFVHSQKNANVKKELKQADLAYEKADFLTAFTIYSGLLKHEPLNADMNFKAGVSLFSMDKTDTASLKYFDACKSKVAESHYYLGKIYQLTGQSRRAIEEFYYFKSINTEETIDNADVNNWIKICESAIKEEGRKSNFIIKNLGENINSKFADYVPLMWEANESLIFTSRRADSKGGLKDPYGRFYEDIYIAKKQGTIWSKPVSIGDNLNTSNHDACVALSSSGNELIIYRTDVKQTGGDFYLCTYDGTKWSDPVIMGTEINSEFLEASACFSSSGDEIIFSSNRPGGFGGKDLYKVRKFMNGQYSLPANLGPNINTSEDEDSPFLDEEKILYFSSKGHNSMGEYDIFKASYDPETLRWKDPENLGMPINSTNDDIYFVKLKDQQSALFTSRREGGYGDADIYSMNFNETTQLVTYCKFFSTMNKSELNDLQLTIYDVETGRMEGKYRPNKNYMSMVLVTTKDKMYKVIIEGGSIEPLVKNMIFTENDKELSFELNKRIK